MDKSTMIALIIAAITLLFAIPLFIGPKNNLISGFKANESPNKTKTIKEQLIEKRIVELSELKEKNLIGEDEFKERARTIFEKI